jgi:ubiquinone/menaquinone biosynthesis C-methylase UbiE
MIQKRIPETDEGIQEHLTVAFFDSFARHMRDKGWNNVDSFIAAGITGGSVLEIGPGPGYVGLEWLRRSPGAQLTGLEISREMIAAARKNAGEYGLTEKVTYIEGNCMNMPFPDATFDAVISNGSLHEWEDPVRTFGEVYRVLKSGGKFCITDLRRDIPFLMKLIMYRSCRPKEIRPGLLSSLRASYTAEELEAVAGKSQFRNVSVTETVSGLCVSGVR